MAGAKTDRPIRLFDAKTHSLELLLPEPVSVHDVPIDVSRLPGATVTSAQRFEGLTTRWFAGCVTGASSRFVDGVQSVLFEKATWLALSNFEQKPARLTTLTRDGSLAQYEQLLEGLGSEGTPFRVHHVLTFHGDRHDLLLCSMACRGAECRQSELQLSGTPPPQPEPGLLARTLLASIEHAEVSVAGLGTLLAVASLLVILRRPYPRP
jgi:hypothetical protein